MNPSPKPSSRVSGSWSRLKRPAQVLIITSVMFTFISYWKTAAVVLCDLASTAFYIGGIVEQSIGPAAPWFILAVMIFSFAVRSVYIESCTLFIRGGVYRVVREALGRGIAKFAVSALMFDYVLTGPISGVSAGQYIMGLLLESIVLIPGMESGVPRESAALLKQWGSVLIACGVTLYFFRQNLLGIHESSDKALKIMIATTVMGVVVLIWCGITLAIKGPQNEVPVRPDLSRKVEYQVVTEEDGGTDRLTGESKDVWKRVQNEETGRYELAPMIEDDRAVPRLNKITGHQEDPLGFLGRFLPESMSSALRKKAGWLSLIGLFGMLLAFGHSILAMSGEETLAQVYREVEAPKLANFKKAAFIVFVYSILLTGTISFLAVLLIPDEVRMKDYAENLLGGLSMHVLGPRWACLLLNACVVVVGFLILSGAVNTSIIGSNGVLNRVSEDGVLPKWFLKPHPKYGTSSRLLYLIVGLQLFTIVASRGNTLLLGEAYAFGVVWSFVFQALSMVVLRFKDRRPREYKVPFNLPLGKFEIPIGLLVVLVVLLMAAIVNFLTKETATVGGMLFTSIFFVLFLVSERYHEKKGEEKHLEQFNQETSHDISPAGLGLAVNSYRKLVSIRSSRNLHMLEKALAETDPETTSLVVMTAKVSPKGSDTQIPTPELDVYDQELMTAVVQQAEKAGKVVVPLIVPTNNPLHAVLKTAKDLQAHELIVGASNVYTADEQMEQLAFYWVTLHGGQTPPLTVRILGRNRDMYLDLGGGNRIPKISERKARSVAELRAAGIGVHRVLMLHDGTPSCGDLFEGILTALDPAVGLTIVPMIPLGSDTMNGHSIVKGNVERAAQLERELNVVEIQGDPAEALVRLAREQQYDLIILPLPPEASLKPSTILDARTCYILEHAHCRVFLASTPTIPQEIVDTTS